MSVQEVEKLITQAAKTGDSGDALRFSQAACNVANAMRVLVDIKVAAPQEAK